MAMLVPTTISLRWLTAAQGMGLGDRLCPLWDLFCVRACDNLWRQMIDGLFCHGHSNVFCLPRKCLRAGLRLCDGTSCGERSRFEGPCMCVRLGVRLGTEDGLARTWIRVLGFHCRGSGGSV